MKTYTIALLTAAFVCVLATVAKSQEACYDVELALVADISSSMTFEEKDIQRKGYAAAFRTADVLNAITSGYCGKIAVKYIEFATYPHTVIDWVDISSPAHAEAFARALEAEPFPIDRVNTTGLANALEDAAQSILNNGIDAGRMVIDISFDGPDNVTENAAEIRDRYTIPTKENGWREMTINGIVVMLDQVYYGMTAEGFMEYARENVTGGPGSFVRSVTKIHQLPQVVREKIAQEIG